MYMLRIKKCGHQGLPNAEPAGWKNADPEDHQKRSLRIAKYGAWQVNNVIAENQEILIMIVVTCTCWELKNADTEDYQMQSPRGGKNADLEDYQKWRPRIAKCRGWELNNVMANMYMLRIKKCGCRGLPNAEPAGWKNIDSEDYQKWSLRIAKCRGQELNNVIANMYMWTIKKCRHRGLPNAEPAGWKNGDSEDYQKRSLRIAKCRGRELKNVIAEEIIMMKNVHVEN